MTTRSGLLAIRKRAAIFCASNLSLGVFAMLLSLLEGSTAWALFIWLASIQGIAIGLLAGPAWSDQVLHRTPRHRKSGARSGFAWSLLTYWAPILATFLFGLILAQTLPDGARPKSSLDGSGGICVFQSWVMFFTAVGCTWLTVWLDTRILIRDQPEEAEALA